MQVKRPPGRLVEAALPAGAGGKIIVKALAIGGPARAGGKDVLVELRLLRWTHDGWTPDQRTTTARPQDIMPWPAPAAPVSPELLASHDLA